VLISFVCLGLSNDLGDQIQSGRQQKVPDHIEDLKDGRESESLDQECDGIHHWVGNDSHCPDGQVNDLKKPVWIQLHIDIG
jgi:hypothetical protein